MTTKTTTIDAIEYRDLFALPNGETRVFLGRQRSDIGEDVRKVAFLDAEGKRCVEPIGKNVPVTLVARDTEIRPHLERRGQVLKSRAEMADDMIWPFANSMERRLKTLRVLSNVDIAAHGIGATHFDAVVGKYHLDLHRPRGVEFDDARSAHKSRNGLAVAEAVARALRAIDGDRP